MAAGDAPGWRTRVQAGRRRLERRCRLRRPRRQPASPAPGAARCAHQTPLRRHLPVHSGHERSRHRRAAEHRNLPRPRGRRRRRCAAGRDHALHARHAQQLGGAGRLRLPVQLRRLLPQPQGHRPARVQDRRRRVEPGRDGGCGRHPRRRQLHAHLRWRVHAAPGLGRWPAATQRGRQDLRRPARHRGHRPGGAEPALRLARRGRQVALRRRAGRHDDELLARRAGRRRPPDAGCRAAAIRRQPGSLAIHPGGARADGEGGGRRTRRGRTLERGLPLRRGGGLRLLVRGRDRRQALRLPEQCRCRLLDARERQRRPGQRGRPTRSARHGAAVSPDRLRQRLQGARLGGRHRLLLHLPRPLPQRQQGQRPAARRHALPRCDGRVPPKLARQTLAPRRWIRCPPQQRLLRRRPGRHHRQARLHQGPRRQRDLHDADLPRQQQPQVRHGRLSPGRPGVRQQPGLHPPDAGSGPARHARHHRCQPEPHRRRLDLLRSLRQLQERRRLRGQQDPIRFTLCVLVQLRPGAEGCRQAVQGLGRRDRSARARQGQPRLARLCLPRARLDHQAVARPRRQWLAHGRGALGAGRLLARVAPRRQVAQARRDHDCRGLVRRQQVLPRRHVRQHDELHLPQHRAGLRGRRQGGRSLPQPGAAARVLPAAGPARADEPALVARPGAQPARAGLARRRRCGGHGQRQGALPPGGVFPDDLSRRARHLLR